MPSPEYLQDCGGLQGTAGDSRGIETGTGQRIVGRFQRKSRAITNLPLTPDRVRFPPPPPLTLCTDTTYGLCRFLLCSCRADEVPSDRFGDLREAAFACPSVGIERELRRRVSRESLRLLERRARLHYPRHERDAAGVEVELALGGALGDSR